MSMRDKKRGFWASYWSWLKMEEYGQKADCPEGSVHAWKDTKGKLFTDLDKRDDSNKHINAAKLRGRLVNLLILPVHEVVKVEERMERLISGDDDYGYSMDYIMQKRGAALRSDMRPEQVADALIKNWDYIKESIEEMKNER